MTLPLTDLYKELAIANAQGRPDADPAAEELFQARAFRRRLAGLMWIPGAAAVLVVAGWTGSGVLGVAGLIALVVALWIYAERPAYLRTRLIAPLSRIARRRRGA
jgi:hypothetical protein